MKATTIRKVLTLLATLIAAVLPLLPEDANAALATLVSCQMTQVGNQYSYLGTYSLNGQHITLMFSQYCPASVNL